LRFHPLSFTEAFWILHIWIPHEKLSLIMYFWIIESKMTVFHNFSKNRHSTKWVISLVDLSPPWFWNFSSIIIRHSNRHLKQNKSMHRFFSNIFILLRIPIFFHSSAKIAKKWARILGFWLQKVYLRAKWTGYSESVWKTASNNLSFIKKYFPSKSNPYSPSGIFYWIFPWGPLRVGFWRKIFFDKT